jgi:hypothetical protein
VAGPRLGANAPLDEIAALRRLAWSHAGCPDARQANLDSVDSGAHHFWLRDGAGAIVAAARVSLHPDLSSVPDSDDFFSFRDRIEAWTLLASLNRLVIHPGSRGSGLPTAFDTARIDLARNLGARAIVASARGRRRTQLEQLDFAPLGPIPTDVLASQGVTSAGWIALLRVMESSEARSTAT